DMLCIPAGIQLLYPVSDIWRQSIGMFLGIHIPGLFSLCCFPAYC
ncbi:15063_t:CDS:1, partial [Gigaspora rosea]